MDDAKAFLCWDIFPNLSVQLIDVSSAIGYFLPPTNDRPTIVIFYRAGNPDFSRALYTLFHEAGHCLQYEEWERTDRVSEFQKVMDMGTGAIKTAFEREAWDWGRDMLKDFLKKKALEEDILENYDSFATKCLESYL